MMLVYKILRAHEWAVFDAAGFFAGSPDDLRDGFIHLSAAEQVAGTLARYFGDDDDLVFLTLDAGALGSQMRWEMSRNGVLFPHLYRPLERGDVIAAVDKAPD